MIELEQKIRSANLSSNSLVGEISMGVLKTVQVGLEDEVRRLTAGNKKKFRALRRVVGLLKSQGGVLVHY